MDKEVMKVIKKISNNKEKNIKIVKKYLDDYDLDIIIEHCLNSYKNIFSEEKILLIIEALLECGADVNYIEYERDFNFLQYALNDDYSKEFNLKLLDILIKYNINLNNKDKWGDTFFDDLYSRNTIKLNQITPIYKKLVNNGFDIFRTDTNYYNYDNEEWPYSTYYIDKEEFNKEFRKDRKNKYETRKNEIVNEIITKYPNLDYRNENNQSLLHILVTCYYDEEMILDIIHDLFEKGIEINSIDGDEQNFIHTALTGNHSDSFKNKLVIMSLNYGLDPNTLSKGNYNIIYNLIYHAKNIKLVPIYKILVEKGFNKEKEVFKLLNNCPDFKDKTEFIQLYLNNYVVNKSLELIYTINEANKEQIIKDELLECTRIYDIEEFNNNNLKDIIECILFSLRNVKEINIDDLHLNIYTEILYVILSKDENLIHIDNISKIGIINNIVNNMYLQNYRFDNNLDIDCLIYGIKNCNYINYKIKDIVIGELIKLKQGFNKDNIGKLMKTLVKK